MLDLWGEEREAGSLILGFKQGRPAEPQAVLPEVLLLMLPDGGFNARFSVILDQSVTRWQRSYEYFPETVF